MSEGTAEHCVDGNPESDLPLDAVLGLLTHPRRRFILLYFINQLSDDASVDDLTEFVYRWETESNPELSRDTIRISLERTHLPALVDAGVLEYDDRAETVAYIESDRLERVHSAVMRGTDR